MLKANASERASFRNAAAYQSDGSRNRRVKHTDGLWKPHQHSQKQPGKKARPPETDIWKHLTFSGAWVHVSTLLAYKSLLR